MAVCLNAWLEETFQSQLLLGSHWLRQRYETKASGVHIKLDRDWEGVYHDNGSCLDIINHIHPEHNTTLQVLQARDVTMFSASDLTCLRQIRSRSPTAVTRLSPTSRPAAPDNSRRNSLLLLCFTRAPLFPSVITPYDTRPMGHSGTVCASYCIRWIG